MVTMRLGLIQANFSVYNDEKILKTVEKYAQYLHRYLTPTLRDELSFWRQQWKQDTTYKPISAIDSLPYCISLQPNIQILL